MIAAAALALATAATDVSVPPISRVVSPSLLALRGGGGASLPQTVLACAGGAVSVSGMAALVDPRWTRDEAQTRKLPKPFDMLDNIFDKRKKEEESAANSQTVGVALIGLGLAKLAITRHAPDLVHQIARLNFVAAAVLWFRRGGRRGALLPGIPVNAQSVLMGLYACVGLGLKKIPRPGNDRYPDRFLEHLGPQKLHLA